VVALFSRLHAVALSGFMQCNDCQLRRAEESYRYAAVFPEGRTPLNTTFENNIFYFEGKGKWGVNAEGINTVFRNNLYFNISPHKSETAPISADPMFIKPGIAGADIDLKTMNALRGYRLRPGSPCIDTGVKIKNHGRKDLLGAKAPIRKADIGAFERD